MVFAAYQVRIFFINRQVAQPPAPTLSTYSSNDDFAASQSASAPAEMLGQAAGHANLKPFDGDPAGIVPPHGAQGREGFSQEFTGATTYQRVYDAQEELDTLRGYYLNSLQEKGFKLLRDESLPQGSRLVFIKGRVHVTVFLRNQDEKDKIVRITVTAIHPSADK